MIYTTDSFRDDCKILAEQVSSYPFTHILSVDRGGGYVVRELIKYHSKAIVVPIKVSFYDGQVKREKPIVEYAAGKVFTNDEKVLICDDLLDSGETVKYIKNHHILKKAGNVKVAVLIKKPISVIEPDFCVRQNVTGWCQFYWEDANGNHYSDLGVSHTSKLYASA
jgi:hypoxanthine phosphoribosyltransferase